MYGVVMDDGLDFLKSRWSLFLVPMVLGGWLSCKLCSVSLALLSLSLDSISASVKIWSFPYMFVLGGTMCLESQFCAFCVNNTFFFGPVPLFSFL